MKPSNESAWSAAVPKVRFPKLNSDLKTDVAIIGGGMAGLLSAYLLAKSGHQVVVLEANELLSGATLYTTAFLTSEIDTAAVNMISIYGIKKSKLVRQSHDEAINLIERIVKREQIDCEFRRCSYYIYANQPEDLEGLLVEEREAMQKLGADASLHKTGRLYFPQHGYIELKQQAKFHPIKFLAGLLTALERLGVQIYEHTEAEKVTGTSSGSTVKAGGHKVKALYAITATYNPMNNPIQTFMKKGMYISYVYELQIKKGLFKEGIYQDSNNPYHYFRVDRGPKFDRMVIGGEDNRAEIEFSLQKNFRALKHYIDHIMGKHKYTVVGKWRGQILEPSDGLALIGKFKPHQLVATAFSGNGMTYSGIAAAIFRDTINRKKNKYTAIYDPTRIPTIKQLVRKGLDYSEEFIHAAARNTLKY